MGAVAFGQDSLNRSFRGDSFHDEEHISAYPFEVRRSGIHFVQLIFKIVPLISSEGAKTI